MTFEAVFICYARRIARMFFYVCTYVCMNVCIQYMYTKIYLYMHQEIFSIICLWMNLILFNVYLIFWFAGLASKSSFLKCSIAQSNLACVLLEVYGPNHPTGSGKYWIFIPLLVNILYFYLRIMDYYECMYVCMYVCKSYLIDCCVIYCSDASFLLEGAAKMIMDSLGG